MTSDARASAEQIPELLRQRPDAVLVGGQALVVWSNVLGIKPSGPLDPYVTSDIDFLGTRKVAEELGKRLHTNVLAPPADDHVQVNSAVLLLGDKKSGQVIVDFLNAVVGLDSEKLKERAQEIEAFGTTFKVMHPVDCLVSRIANLRSLPDKRNDAGIAQAKLAVQIVRAFISGVIRDGNERHALDLANFVERLAAKAQTAQVSAQYGIDVMESIPVGEMPQAYREKQWPRAEARVGRRLKRQRPAPKK